MQPLITAFSYTDDIAQVKTIVGEVAEVLSGEDMQRPTTAEKLPADNAIVCTLSDPQVPELARALHNTRSAAALELWRPHLAGAVVAIGNAPTALFHLLNMLEDPSCPRPAAIIGCPVGFIGAAESKDALMAAPPVPSVIVQGRLMTDSEMAGRFLRPMQDAALELGALLLP